VELSATQVNTRLPVWNDYRPLLERVAGQTFPDCAQLNDLLKVGLCSKGGHQIRFVPSDHLDDQPYERRIFSSGQVSTRSDNWHDLFNALVWARFPAVKVAMNACHQQAWSDQRNGRRGQLRDALTLFDECGVIVFSSNLTILEALSQRHWSAAFLDKRFQTDFGGVICGHAMLEKYLSPYKSMTAKALLIHVETGFMNQSREDMLLTLDQFIANGLLAGELLSKPASLAPLPLSGIPGWWPRDEQLDEGFYEDQQVFRAPPLNLVAAPIIELK
jgi:hypothetical protein